ncbi:hypothetical protein E6C27_scaffold89G004070 [Cucumis melo var. makuwa]|uniref:Uncharacterized protein n=1 Tax=Cucumis melo var. makuwa TaxID=1194695 RepID=A0A5A7V436_CUCMM|nr:hypothetical protein E6C27_scaffold89G004070 [Cucumis melo var. makuwa]
MEGRSGTFVVWRGENSISNPTSTGGQSGFYLQIHRPSRSDRTPSSFGGVTPPPVIQLLLENNRAFAVRFTTLVRANGRLSRLEGWLYRQRSNFYWGTIELLPSYPPPWGRSNFCCQIHHLGRSNRAFAVGSTALIHRLIRSDQTPSSFGEVTPLLAIQPLLGDHQTFAIRSTALIGAIERLLRLER